MLGNTREAYGLIAQLLHWLTAALIVFLLALGVYMQELPSGTAADAAQKFWLYSLHKTVGMSAFSVAIVRVLWAIVQPRPHPLKSHRKLERLIAASVHWTLYGAIIVMPLTGYLHHSATTGYAPIWWPLPKGLAFIPKDPAWAEFFATAHYLTANLLFICILLHIAGALKHTFVDRDTTLHRMLLESSPAPETTPPAARQERLAPAIAALLFLTLGVATIIMAQPKQSVTSEAPPRTAPAGWQLDLQKSRLGIQVVQSGSVISGHFRKWTAAIDLEPESLENARIDVAIKIASLTLGGAEEQAVAPDFLNAQAFPVARFVARDITRIDTGRYQAKGQLSLAGTTRALTLPFDLTIANDRAVAVGKAKLNRLDYGVGAEGYPDDGLVGIEVLVEIKVEADKVTASQ
ncbi:MAG: cytochrome b/b6 domain-containing protein [Hyphomicrobiaceae bacterium]